MWLIITYRPTALFSLRKSFSTDAAGKTLPVPSPFALKMAFLDVVYKAYGPESVKSFFGSIRGAETAIKPPPYFVTNGVIIRVLQESRDKVASLKRNIAYREFVSYAGDISFALCLVEDKHRDMLSKAATMVNYLGKRSSFFQLIKEPEVKNEIDPKEFIQPFGTNSKYISPDDKFIAHLDDTGPDAELDRINVYSSERIRPGVDRISRLYLLPYKLMASGKSYSAYKRI
jgi:hypothetical protein